MIKRFYNCMKDLLKGNDVGLRPNPFLTGNLPILMNRAQRREEQRKWK